MDPEPPTPGPSTTGSPTPTPAAGRPSSPPPLLRWLSPTRGYVLVAVIAGAGLLVVGVTWQSWLLLASSGPSAQGGAGWSLASMVVLMVAVIVLVELARRPQPRAAGPRDRARQARARTRQERKVVRRAMWLGRLPARPRLQRAAAHRLEAAVGNVLLVPLYLLFAAAALGVAGRPR